MDEDDTISPVSRVRIGGCLEQLKDIRHCLNAVMGDEVSLLGESSAAVCELDELLETVDSAIESAAGIRYT